ncbi:MAG: GGDEF domain-containing protein [Pseudomonas sp.]
MNAASPASRSQSRTGASPKVVRDDRWVLRRWSGEFADPLVEQAYLRHNEILISRQMQFSLLIWGALVLLFAWPDYQAMGPSEDFRALLTMRLFSCAMLFALFVAIRFKPALATRGLWITLVQVFWGFGFLMIYQLRPDMAIWSVIVTVIMLVSLFVFVPNRLPTALFAALIFALGTVMSVHSINPKTPGEMLGIFIFLLLPIATGWAAAMRTQVLQRRQYALLEQAQEVNRQLQQEIEERIRLQEVLTMQAATDPLTGLNNRRQYETLFEHELARAKRKGKPLSLCIIDLDHFKRINDTWGHSAGDEVLRRIAGLCWDNFRSIDIIGRLGGEEFVVLLPDTDRAAAVNIAQRFIEALAATQMHIGGEVLQITATAGVVERQKDEDQLDLLIQRADKAMYEGKLAGRNRVVIG